MKYVKKTQFKTAILLHYFLWRIIPIWGHKQNGRHLEHMACVQIIFLINIAELRHFQWNKICTNKLEYT